MYEIKCNNKIFYKSLLELLPQCNFQLLSVENKINYGLIIIDLSDNKLSIDFNNPKEVIALPSSSDSILNKFIQLLSDHKINFDSLLYSPTKQLLQFEKSTLKLRNTHNLIIQEALLTKETGILKEDLYKIIWPQDVNIQINKLDTHLTNLKTVLQDHFNYELKFSSNSGLLKFLIN